MINLYESVEGLQYVASSAAGPKKRDRNAA